MVASGAAQCSGETVCGKCQIRDFRLSLLVHLILSSVAFLHNHIFADDEPAGLQSGMRSDMQLS